MQTEQVNSESDDSVDASAERYISFKTKTYCHFFLPKRPITAITPLANLAPVKAEARNKTDPRYVLLAEVRQKRG